MDADVLLMVPDNREHDALVSTVEDRKKSWVAVDTLEEAYEKFQEVYPDVLVLPGLRSGTKDVIRRIRSEPLGDKPLILVVLVEETSREQLNDYLAAGADDYVRGVEQVSERLLWSLWKKEHQVAETRYQKKNDRYRFLFERSRDGLTITTPEGHVVEANPAALRIFGLQKEELKTLNVHSLYVNKERRGEFERQLEQKGAIEDFEARMCRTDGTEIICKLTTTAQRNSAGEIVAYHTVICDITKERKLQQKLLRIVEDQQQDVGDYLHESLASRLTGISMLGAAFARQLETGQALESDQLWELVRLAREGIKKTRALSRGLQPTKLDQEGLLHGLEELVAKQEQESGVKLLFHVTGDLPKMSQEFASQLYWIAQDAIAAAIERAGTTEVVVQIREEGEELVLSIEDDGMPPVQPGAEEGERSVSFMHYRTRLMGGIWRMEVNDKGGTTIECRLSKRKLVEQVNSLPAG